jgi:hypothetical protein
MRSAVISGLLIVAMMFYSTSTAVSPAIFPTYMKFNFCCREGGLRHSGGGREKNGALYQAPRLLIYYSSALETSAFIVKA